MGRSACFSGTAVVVAASTVLAGPLDPPAGPVAPTHKTLTQVEPRSPVGPDTTPGDADSTFKITEAGSYYLTGNVMGESGKHGIEIAAGGVTLDLMGFELVGVPGSLDGVHGSLADSRRVVLLNGLARDWGQAGVALDAASDGAVEGIAAMNNGAAGIHVGAGWTVSRCTARGNVDGIRIGTASAITDCATLQNFSIGIRTASGCTIAASTAHLNGGNGINTSIGCTVDACSATNNTGDGISVSAECVVNACTTARNDGHGIESFGAGMISGCTAAGNALNGIRASAHSTIVSCTVQNNDVNGIEALVGCTVMDCTSNLNDGNGIQGSRLLVSGCSAGSNTGNGISVDSSSTVRGNTVSSNGVNGDGAGILVTGSGNRLEGNACNGNDRGIDVNGSGNFIVANTARSNTTNYDIIASNRYGPIVNITSSGAAAVTGNSAAGVAGTADPWANFAH